MGKEPGNTIAVVAANFKHTFPSRILRKLEECAAHGYNIAQWSTSALPDYEADQLRKILEKENPAALIAVCMNPEKSILDEYTKRSIPVVIIDEVVSGFTTVTNDNFAGGHMGAEYLIKSGRKKIGLITGRINVEGGYNSRERTEGFKQALEENGIIFRENRMIEVQNYSYSEGAQALEVFLRENVDIDSVFCAAGDMCALGVMKTAREKKIKIPQDIAVVGYDDIEQAAKAHPPLTTIKQPVEEMAAKAFELALKRKESAIGGSNHVLFKPELVKRQSA